MDREECLWSQWLSLEAHDTADYILTAFHAGRGQAVFGGSTHLKVDAIVSKDEDGVRKIVIANFDSVLYHGGFHDRDCRFFDETQKVVYGDGFLEGGGGGGGNESQKDYAQSLTRAAEEADLHVVFEYETHSECVYFHGKSLTARSGKSYPSLRKLLLAEHPDEVVVGSGSTSGMSQESLLKKIRCLGPESDYFGFAVVLGGRETREENFPPELFGFCHQRRPVNAAEIGEYTEQRVLKKCGGDEEEASLFLEQKAQIPQTMTARSFHGRGETLSLSYLKFLIEQRDFKDFVVAHFVMYRRKRFLLPFLEKNLQGRHELQKVEGSLLERNTKKLILNS
jgi:hypothetical protein